MTSSRFLFCLGLAFILSPVAAKTAKHHASPKPVPAVAAPSPAVAVVQQYLAARQDQQEDKAYALLSANTQTQFPRSQREDITKSLTDPTMLKGMPASLLPVMALFVDLHNTLHFRFRILGASPEDAGVVLVRAYQIGTPPSTVKTLKVATVPDPVAPGSLLIDGEKTAMLADPSLMGARAKAQQAISQSNLKQIALAILQYTQDHDEMLPDADTWVEDIMPYLKSDAAFRDPAAPDQKWSYAFNRTLSGVALSEIENPASTVMLFESMSGQKNAADAGDTVPLPGRHNGGTDYGFADGHIKWEADDIKVSYSLHGN